MSVSGYFRVTRPVNAAAAGFAAALAFWITGGADMLTALLLFFAVACICGAGNAVNDLFDADIDRINRPERPIPRGDISIRGCAIFSVLLFAAGFLCSLPVLPWCPCLAAVNILLLIMYSTSFKRMPVLGNVCVSYLTGSVFLFGGMAVGPESFLLTAPLFLVTFFGTLSREIVKDAEDIEGDKKVGAYTLPMMAGIPASAVTAFICMVLGVFASFIPAVEWGIFYAAAICAVDIFLLWAGFKVLSCKTAEDVRESEASRYMKVGMFAAILVFFLAALAGRYLFV